jgi:hypothetical protein
LNAILSLEVCKLLVEGQLHVNIVTIKDYLATLNFKAADKHRLIMVHFKYLTWYNLNKAMPFTTSVTNPTAAR